jgi:uncharacterized damage-inducible protein DinB
MGMVDALLPEFDHEMSNTRRVLERVPEARFDWKPHTKSTSLGELASHVASLPTFATQALSRDELDIGTFTRPAAMASTAALLTAFDANASAARAALAGRTDAELMSIWSLKQNGRTVFTMPKATVLRSFVMNHLIHHRAQLGVYLRLLDVPVPAIYGPSADEQPNF